MENLKLLGDFLELIDFLDEDITPAIASRIVDEAKAKLSKPELLALGDSSLQMSAEAASVFTLISEYDAEMGGLAHY